MNKLSFMIPLAVGIAIGSKLTPVSTTVADAVPVNSTAVSLDSVIQVHLAVYEVTPDGVRVPSSPVQRALMEFNCRSDRYRRLGADVQRPDGVVDILDEKDAGYGWRVAQPNGPEYMQIHASCARR